jgi:hypothetical protein
MVASIPFWYYTCLEMPFPGALFGQYKLDITDNAVKAGYNDEFYTDYEAEKSKYLAWVAKQEEDEDEDEDAEEEDEEEEEEEAEEEADEEPEESDEDSEETSDETSDDTSQDDEDEE